jgi:hypothetical protein
MLRLSIICFSLLFSINLWAQQLRVLVVPFDQFQFECPMPLDEIAKHNALSSPDEVYRAYANALLQSMNTASDSLTIYQTDKNSLAQIHRQLPRVYKREPVSHNGVDIKAFKESGKLASYLDNMGADYLMVISRYKIMGKLITSRGSWDNSGGFISWSIHQLDYEVFNRAGELVAMADRFTIRPKNPRSDNYQTQGLVLADLSRGMQQLGMDLEQKLLKHRKKGKVAFKSKYD